MANENEKKQQDQKRKASSDKPQENPRKSRAVSVREGADETPPNEYSGDGVYDGSGLDEIQKPSNP